MAYKIRNLILDAYTESGVKGRGMPVTADDENEALSQLNIILTEVFAGKNNSPTSAVAVSFTGASDYSIGPAPLIITDPQPDIEIDIRPNFIDKIILTQGASRLTATPISPTTYYDRSLDSISNSLPSAFYYEKSNPWGFIRFYEGTPSGSAELIMQPSLTNVTANTDFMYFPESIKPFLVAELGSRILHKEELDPTVLRLRASTAWRLYKQSIYEGQAYNADSSAPGFGGNDKYNIYTGD